MSSSSSSSGSSGRRGSGCRSSSRNACNESSEVARVVVTHHHHHPPGSGEKNSIDPTMVSSQANCTTSFSHHRMIRRSEKRTRTEALEREEEEEDFLNDDRNNSENDPDRKPPAAAAAATAATAVVSMPPRKTRNRRSCSNGTSCSVPTTCILPTPPRNEKQSSSIRSQYATERSTLDVLKVGPMSHVLTYLEEIDLYQLELAFWDVRRYSLPQWQALRQADISSIHCAKWRHSHNNRRLFLSLVQAIRPPSNASHRVMRITKATSTTSLLDEWARASHAYRTAGYIPYAKDYVHHISHTRKLLHECQGRPPIPINMTIGDLARSGYFVFVHLALNDPPPSTATTITTKAATATTQTETSNPKEDDNDDEDDSQTRAVETTKTTVKPDCVQSKASSTDDSNNNTAQRRQRHPLRRRKHPQHFDAFRKVRQAVYYPSTGKMLLKFENPVAHFLGMRSEWPQIKSFNDWHQIDWTILNQLKLSGRIGSEIESVLSYERNCHARLLPLLQNMDIAITLPKHCLDDEGNSVYPANQVQQRLGVRPPPPDVLGDFFADAQQRALQAQLQRLQQETVNLRRQLNGLAAQVNGLVADVRRDRAMDGAIDHAVLAQRLQHALGNVVHPNHPQQMNMNPHPIAVAAAAAADGIINNNHNHNQNINHVVEGNQINNGNDFQGNVLDDHQMEAALVRRNALQPSSNPPSPETFIVTGRCTKLLWTSQYTSEFRRPILQSLPPGATHPEFTTDIFLDHHSRRSPPRESHSTDGTSYNHSVTNTSTSGSIVSSSVPNNNHSASTTTTTTTTTCSVSPWEVSIPVTPTLVAIFEVYRLSHPDDG
ncbi:hypothetical protein IV203_019103 [Nitzschia inconspicua]|uniref:Uncharacterized protein n=1 Tax=Nitzschia inconspicua TaxID=303405 RepID=A0A9K3LYU6_9STRA|nr:hypothetical protein IV203_019103 [Nitzschia inconspicua]